MSALYKSLSGFFFVVFLPDESAYIIIEMSQPLSRNCNLCIHTWTYNSTGNSSTEHTANSTAVLPISGRPNTADLQDRLNKVHPSLSHPFRVDGDCRTITLLNCSPPPRNSWYWITRTHTVEYHGIAITHSGVPRRYDDLRCHCKKNIYQDWSSVLYYKRIIGLGVYLKISYDDKRWSFMVNRCLHQS